MPCAWYRNNTRPGIRQADAFSFETLPWRQIDAVVVDPFLGQRRDFAALDLERDTPRLATGCLHQDRLQASRQIVVCLHGEPYRYNVIRFSMGQFPCRQYEGGKRKFPIAGCNHKKGRSCVVVQLPGGCSLRWQLAHGYRNR